MRDIVWGRQAERDLEHTFGFVLQHHPGTARHLFDHIERLVARVRDHPQIGRPGRVPGTRELMVAGTAFIVVYRVAASQIDILAVIYAARRWPQTFD